MLQKLLNDAKALKRSKSFETLQKLLNAAKNLKRSKSLELKDLTNC
jgi:hypothetical protein